MQVSHVTAELEAHGVRWRSERRIRRDQATAELAGDRAESRRYSLELSWLEESHRPDLLIWPSQTAVATEQPVAVEVELSQKSKRRLDEIMEAYSNALDFAGAVYVCGPHAIAAVRGAVARLEERAHVIDVVSIYEFGRHFQAPNVGGRPPRRKQATETRHRPQVTAWIVTNLTGDPMSALEARLRGPDGATPPLVT